MRRKALAEATSLGLIGKPQQFAISEWINAITIGQRGEERMSHKYYYELSGTPAAAVDVVRELLISNKYRILSGEATNSFIAEQGSLLSTFVFGGFAGDSIFTTYYFETNVNSDGDSTLTMSRNLFDDNANEKFIGFSQLSRKFHDTAEEIEKVLIGHGLLQGRASTKRQH